MKGLDILKELNKPTIYIGEVMDIYDANKSDEDALKEPNSIRFTIPGVTDGIMKYPIARLIGNRTRRVRNGDTVFIIKQGSLNNIFFYMPMDISDFVGCSFDENNLISLKSGEITIKSESNEIKLSKSNEGYSININGHLKVTV